MDRSNPPWRDERDGRSRGRPATGALDLTFARRITLSAALSLGALSLTACGGQDGPSGPSPGPSPGPGSDAFAATVLLSPAQPAAGARLTTSVGYHLPASAGRLAAYLVEIRFDPSRVRFVNELDAPAGSIVVAGASDPGFTDGLLFRGGFEALAPDVGAADLKVTVREALDAELRDLLP
jgi:hypothetical protein